MHKAAITKLSALWLQHTILSCGLGSESREEVPSGDFIFASVCYELSDLKVIQVWKWFAVRIGLEQQLALVNHRCFLVLSAADSQEISSKSSFLLPVIYNPVTVLKSLHNPLTLVFVRGLLFLLGVSSLVLFE